MYPEAVRLPPGIPPPVLVLVGSGHTLDNNDNHHNRDDHHIIDNHHHHHHVAVDYQIVFPEAQAASRPIILAFLCLGLGIASLGASWPGCWPGCWPGVIGLSTGLYISLDIPAGCVIHYL